MYFFHVCANAFLKNILCHRCEFLSSSRYLRIEGSDCIILQLQTLCILAETLLWWISHSLYNHLIYNLWILRCSLLQYWESLDIILHRVCIYIGSCCNSSSSYWNTYHESIWNSLRWKKTIILSSSSASTITVET